MIDMHLSSSMLMQFYTFLETTLVTLSLLPYFIAFFTDGEMPGTPGALAATFITFGKFLDDHFSNITLSFVLLPYSWYFFQYFSFELGICIECYGLFDHAFDIGGS